MIRRFVLDYRGPGDKPTRDVARFGSMPGAAIVDNNLPRTLVIDGPEDVLLRAVDEASDWVVMPQTIYRNPEVCSGLLE